MTSIIAAERLTKAYGLLSAVDSISFTVSKGEVFGFLGPNGAGKMTTTKMIACVSPRTSGSLSVLDLDPDKNPAEIKQRFGIVPQETNPDPDFACVGNLETYAGYFDMEPEAAGKKAGERLGFVQLVEKRDTPVEKLSGGMNRRLILARALVNSPDLLILDELKIGLDPQARHLIWEKLKAFQTWGSTIVLTTHYLDEEARLCDRLVIMANGKILVEGAPSDLVRQHVEYEMAKMKKSDDVLSCLANRKIAHELAGDTILIATDSSRDGARILFGACRPKNLIIHPATLENVFLKLTGRKLKE